MKLLYIHISPIIIYKDCPLFSDKVFSIFRTATMADKYWNWFTRYITK